MAFRNPWNGIVGGGDLDPSDPNNARTAISRTMAARPGRLTNAPPVTGAIFGLAYLQNTTGVGDGGDEPVSLDLQAWQRTRQWKRSGAHVVITADTGGAAWTPDEGNTWYALNGVSGYWCVAFADPQNGWLVGRNGLIFKVSFP